MKKFTFKTVKPTGKYKWLYSNEEIIKLEGMEVGYLTNSTKEHQVRLKVVKSDINEDGNPNCPWKWITLKKKCETIEEIKLWVKVNNDSIQQKFNIYKG